MGQQVRVFVRCEMHLHIHIITSTQLQNKHDINLLEK